ncbi:MAG: 50S ribosomal protein L29 [Candidatus Aminicenantes bacterium]|nr:50S ribosomal protein L29 [Candidatus Aminicenantes bacterium]
MKARELQELSDDELKRREEELKDQLFKLRAQHAIGQLENTAKLKNIRREIARLKTILRERELRKEKP